MSAPLTQHEEAALAGVPFALRHEPDLSGHMYIGIALSCALRTADCFVNTHADLFRGNCRYGMPHECDRHQCPAHGAARQL
jgi:hypothetical protein